MAKIGHDAKAIAFAKWQYGSKIKHVKNTPKTIVQERAKIDKCDDFENRQNWPGGEG